jgi:hypothetical protein
MGTVDSDFSKPFAEQEAELPPEIYNAVITCHGQLAPNYQYIAELRKMNEQIEARREAAKAVLADPDKPRGLKRNMSLL